MKIIVIQKNAFFVNQYSNVSNIAYSSGNITITYGSNQTATYSLENYVIQIVV